MTTRKTFLRNSFLGTAAVISTNSMPLSLNETPDWERVTGVPIVISTWDFGQAANAGAWQVLSSMGSALDAVEKGINITEADPTNQSVGYGGLPDRDGFVTLDACIMDDKFNCGSVMCLEHIMHPVSVARQVMQKTPHIILTGEGALQFALANGFKKINLLTSKSEKDWRRWLETAQYQPVINTENRLYDKSGTSKPGGANNHDTIGMLALDANGNLSGACSTSGMAYKMHGRVGDSPVIGAGLYVDNEVGAATATGVGEEVIRMAGAHLIVEFMRQGLGPSEACKKGVERIIKISPSRAKTLQVGFLALNTKGEYGAYCLQKGFTFAVKSGKEEMVHKSESAF